MGHKIVRGLVTPCIYGCGTRQVVRLRERYGIVEVRADAGTGRGGADVAGLAWRLALPPFRSPVLEPYLHSGFVEVEFQCEFFSGKDVGVRGSFECAFEFF